MVSSGRSRASAFFDSYRVAFEQLDARGIADHFAYPSHITSDAGKIALMPIAAESDWIDQVEHLLDLYRAIGFSSAQVLDLTATELSPRLVQAVVHWQLYDGAGRSLYDFRASYTLVDMGGGLRIAAIAHDEIPRYRACLARLESQRAEGDRAMHPSAE